MFEEKMDDFLKKLGLSDRRARFLEEKISADIAFHLSLEHSFKFGLTN